MIYSKYMLPYQVCYRKHDDPNGCEWKCYGYYARLTQALKVYRMLAEKGWPTNDGYRKLVNCDVAILQGRIEIIKCRA